VDVKDARLDALSLLMKTQKVIYSAIKFVDIAGLVK
jgi:ribosome-binding ATPase YchF (GTP1/OBG family)